MESNFNTLPTTVYLNPKYNLQIIRAELTSDLNIAIDIINLSEQEINELNFEIKYKDKYGNLLFNGNSTFYSIKDLIISPKEIYYLKPITIDSRFEEARAIVVRVSSLTLDNSKIHTYEGEEFAFTLPIITDVKQKRLRDSFGPEIITYSENTPNGWRCVCGVFNEKEAYECKNCKRNKDFVLSNLTEPLINTKLVNLMSNSGLIDEKSKKNIDSLTQTQMVKIAPTTNIIEKDRINKELEKLNNKKKFKIPSYIILICILVVGLFISYNLFTNYMAKENFEEAKEYLSQGQYKEAIDRLEKIKNNDNFEISPLYEKAYALSKSQISYSNANSLMSKGMFIDAIKDYKKVLPEDKENFANSQNRISEIEDIILQESENYIENNDYASSLNLLNQYISVIEESARAQNLKNSIIKYDPSKNSKDIDITEESKTLDKNRAEISKKAQSLINTYQKVIIDKANLRVDPSLESEIVTTLPKGSDIYIYNIKIEGVERIWCEVKAVNSVTSETFDGWISSNTIDTKNDK